MPPARCDGRVSLASLSLPPLSLLFSTVPCFPGCFSSGLCLLLSPPFFPSSSVFTAVSSFSSASPPLLQTSTRFSRSLASLSKLRHRRSWNRLKLQEKLRPARWKRVNVSGRSLLVGESAETRRLDFFFFIHAFAKEDAAQCV